MPCKKKQEKQVYKNLKQKLKFMYTCSKQKNDGTIFEDDMASLSTKGTIIQQIMSVRERLITSRNAPGFVTKIRLRP